MRAMLKDLAFKSGTVMSVIDDIFALFSRYGDRGYGENLSLESHMLQAAAHVEALGGAAPLVAAALLHDIGYFLTPGSEESIAEGRDIEHEALGAAWLSRAFGEQVTAPIALHVEAKRYLCAVEPDYFAKLSDASRASLALQGGAMTPAEADAFRRQPGFEAALSLRRADDLGKDQLSSPPPLAQYRGLLSGLLRPR